jgi:tetratricopeptide (TPR) repeat protein
VLSFLARLARRTALVAILAASALPAAGASLSGAYLAAMQADFRNDYPEAAAYYDQALRLDPDNVLLLTNALISRVAMGDMEASLGLAERLEAADANNQIATLVRVADALATGDFAAASETLAAAGDTVNPLLGGLLEGWIEVGQQDFDAAQATFDGMTGNDALAAYGQYHKALALAFAGDFVSAEEILAGDEDGPLHLNRS